MKNVTGFSVNHSSIESVNSEYATSGKNCIHIINPADEYAFESAFIDRPSDLPASNNGYQIKFDVYYPITNNYDLNVRFFKSGSSYNNMTVTSSSNIQSITITNENYYRLEMFTRTNLTPTEYWISNIRITLL